MTDNEQILTYGPGFPGGNDLACGGYGLCELHDRPEGDSSEPLMCKRWGR